MSKLKKINVDVSFKARWEVFCIGFKHTRKFPGYSLWQEIKILFFYRKLECYFG